MKRKFSKKPVALLVSLVLIVCLAVGGTIAWLSDYTETLTNKFIPGEVTTEVDEKIEGAVKKQVKIKNTGTVNAYIRAMVVFTWQDSEGKVHGILPVETTDYEITWTKDDWVQGEDGFYYYKKPVAPGGSTDELFTDCKPIGNAPDENYKLSVEIIGSGIQSLPADVVKTEWASGVQEVSDTGVLSIKQLGGGAG